METMTQTNQMTETKAVQNSQIRAGQAARMRDLTPAQRRAVMFAPQQVLRARAAKKAKDERQSALSRMWQEEDAEHTKPHATIRKHEEASPCVRPLAMCCAICAPVTIRLCVR